MGGSTSINYCVPITKAKEGQTAIFRSPDCKNDLVKSPSQNLTTMKDIIINSCKIYASSNCLGQIFREEGKQPYVKYITYKQMLDQAKQIASGIINLNLASEPQQLYGMKFIGLFSRNKVQWTLVDAACALYGFVTIPIYDTLGDQNISYVLNHTNLTTCFVNDKSVNALIKTTDLAKLKNLIAFDQISNDAIKKMADRGVKIIHLRDLIQKGKQKLHDFNDKQFARKPQDCLTFSYTSGTTGPPKGAMLSHGNLASFCGSVSLNKQINFNHQDICISYLPLPHVLERQFLYSMIFSGAKIVYYSGDVQKIKDDLALVKPTIFVSVPRLFSRFHDVIKGKFNDLQGWSKTGLEYALGQKMKSISTTGAYTHKVYDRVFFSKTKQALGGRVRLMISGSAPLLPDVHKFLKVVMCCPLLQGYGQTQSTGGVTITAAYDCDCGVIGGPVSSVEFKLVDIPQMNYTSKDKDQEGRPRPRGQLWLRGPCVFMGYYKNEEKTKEAITQDGWLKTGDVAAIFPEKHTIKLIDRKKNIFKLQQGQYVAPQKVQAIYSKSEHIQEVFLHGDSNQSFAVTIVNPVKSYVMKLGEEMGLNEAYDQLCKNQNVRIEILTQLNNIGKKAGLQSFQQAKNIYLDPNGFMLKGILTNTMKIQRHQGRKAYAKEFQGMYAEGMLPAKKQKKGQ